MNGLTTISLLEAAAAATLILLALGICLTFIRLVIGPDPADRIVALDLISVLIVAFLGAFTVYSGQTAFLDVAIAYALIAFLGTAALARFRERLARQTGRNNNDKAEEQP